MTTETVTVKTTFCRVCEPACGLVATVEDGKLTGVKADADHPVTKGFACAKGLAGLDIHHDPDRLNHPYRRRADGDGYEQVGWDDAVPGVAAALRAVIDEHGPEAVAVYTGNPNAFNTLSGPASGAFYAQLGISRYFSSGTQDCANKFAGSEAVFGSSTMHPIPDIEHTDALLVLGANPRVSKGSFISIANPYRELMQARARGAKIWFVNPRDTESAGDRTGETLRIKPDTDTWLLAAMIGEIDRTVGFDPCTAEHGKHVDELRAFVADYPPEVVAPVVGLDAETIRAVARDFATAPSASVHASTGVNMGRHGTLAYWLVHMLSFVTGNLDREGGNILSVGFYRSAKAGRREYERGFTDNEFGRMRRGSLPGNLLADHILSAERPVKALICVAGNPLLSIGGEERFREAMEALDLLVVIDIYRNATAEHAHWLLPATDMFERPDVNLVGLGLQYEPWIQWTDPVVEPQHDRMEEWRIFAALSKEMGLRGPLDTDDPDAEVWSRIDHMLSGRGLTLDDVRATDHGVVFTDGRRPGGFYTDHLQHPDGKVDCCPTGFAPGVTRLAEDFAARAGAPEGALTLIGRRDSRMHNSWYANLGSFKKGARSTNPLEVHPDDAGRLGLVDGGRAVLRSDWGEIEVDIRLDDAVRPGVVAIEHGWGRQSGMRLAADKPGVNMNRLLPSGPGSFDPLSNQAWMTGIPVTLEAL
ncbi:MAG: molybdopterin-dependent oxidoreductase [Actinomycetota bacterium]|nr:molybdopterin-dependent oxidoreductase [Actinomycetota bacterium]